MIDPTKLFVGQRLYCNDGSTAVIIRKTTEFIELEYKGKKYQRPFSVIGEKLFVVPKQRAINSTEEVAPSSVSYLQEPPIVDDCHSCMKNRSEECFGNRSGIICEDYIPIPNIPKNEREHWPKYGDATALKMGEYRND